MKLIKLFTYFSLLICGLKICAEEKIQNEKGRILFLINQREANQALNLYKTYYHTNGIHDFELLHEIGIQIMDEGFRQNDPETRLLALFGASVAAHDDVYYIIEESINSPIPEIQLVAINALSSLQSDRADSALMKGLASNNLLARLETVHQLCKKKHPQAVSQAKTLMYKTPKILLPIFPVLFSEVGSPDAIKELKRLFNNPSDDVRLAVTVYSAKSHLDALLPQIRAQILHHHYAEQEASAYFLGVIKDRTSSDKLRKLTLSQYPTVRLSANLALSKMGDVEAGEAILALAEQKNILAISSLKEVPNSIDLLKELIKDSNPQVSFNALVSLLAQGDPEVFNHIEEILIRDRRDLGFLPQQSPGKAFSYLKVISSANEVLKSNIDAYLENLEFKESILAETRRLSEPQFLQLAHKILSSNQKELVPGVIEHLQEMGTKEALLCLKTYQQKLGAPFVRQYCALALYKMHEKGPYGEILRLWLEQQSNEVLIHFQPFTEWEFGKKAYALTPEEHSLLLIKTCEAFAQQQDNEGIEALITFIIDGHPKNRYALAGLLLRATQ